MLYHLSSDFPHAVSLPSWDGWDDNGVDDAARRATVDVEICLPAGSDASQDMHVMHQRYSVAALLQGHRFKTNSISLFQAAL